ncbi:MAG TPA: exosortase-associated EpsI family protein [Phycisphaerae bacterium]|jgi:hypothetical protein|nr:exosortase-associated EpsI family protein [Phycisphaerae bacterium]
MGLRNTTKKTFQWLVPATALLTLGAMEAWKATLPDASEGRPFLNHIKETFKNYPQQVGEWEGANGDLPKEAVAMLHPNFYLDRQYVNLATREVVGLFLIEAEDSRDMMGHYPPNCYPGNGWVLVNTLDARNDVDDKPEWIVVKQKTADEPEMKLRITGKEYEFKREYEHREERLWVRNFFLLPNGRIFPEISSFSRAASDFYIRPYGATQVQVVFNREYLPEDRERIFRSIIAAHLNLLNALRDKNSFEASRKKD